MIIPEFIKSSLDYIGQNLKTEITAEELARMANYSVWHYCRLFYQAVGSSVANYILKRRLDCVLAEMSSGRKAIGAVLEYGFNTYAGFYKAFVKMYGCSPKKYLSIYKNQTIQKPEVLIMYSKEDLRKILENWDIPKDLKIEDISEYDWKIWKIGGEYYLKSNERSKMIRNIKIPKALKNQGLDSEFLPIPIKSGEEYLDGENIFLLTRKISTPSIKRPLNDDEIVPNKDRANHAEKYGQSLAKLHQAFKSVQDDVKPDEVNIYNLVMEWAMPETKKYNQKYNMGITEEFFNDYIENFGKLYDKLPKQFIHRNPHGGNIVFKNGEVIGFTGFEYYNEFNIRLFDVLYVAGELNTQPFEEYLDNLKRILKGYDSINPLTKEEKQAIYYVMCATGMIFVAYCDETLDVARRNRDALILIMKSKELLSNLF